MTEIILVRHAENDWVRTGKLAGWTPGVHLNEYGRLQAAALAERLSTTRIVAIYSSPLERTLETAEAIAARHPGLVVQTLDALGEVRFGAWQGQPLRKLRREPFVASGAGILPAALFSLAANLSARPKCGQSVSWRPWPDGTIVNVSWSCRTATLSSLSWHTIWGCISTCFSVSRLRLLRSRFCTWDQNVHWSAVSTMRPTCRPLLRPERLVVGADCVLWCAAEAEPLEKRALALRISDRQRGPCAS